MADNNITSVMDAMMKNMDHLVGTKTVIGESVKVGDAVIIPLVDVSFGIAAGATSRDKKNAGAGGLNAKLSPSAVLMVQDGHARVINVKNADSVSKIIDLVPEVIDKIKARKAVTVDEDEAAKAAFPDDTDIVKED